ncbi:MAG: hypothetical protein ACK5UD_21450, partial [Planctomyces sp.]
MQTQSWRHWPWWDPVEEREVTALDRHALDEVYAGVGSLAYDPLMLLQMVLYQYLKGRRSPA